MGHDAHGDDYHSLNMVTTPDKHPCQAYKTFQTACMVAKFFQIYLARGYHQIPVATEDIPKIAIVT
jgi:hypothetical protein